MIIIRSESYVSKLIEILSVCCEFPAQSLSIIGNMRVVKAMVHKCESVHEIKAQHKEAARKIQLFSVSGRGTLRTIRFHKSGLEILPDDAHQMYLQLSRGHRFTGRMDEIERNHRVAEAVAMAAMAGYEFRPYNLPELQMETIESRVTNSSVYLSKAIKALDGHDMKKTGFTRIVGALFVPDGAYAMYNTRGTAMKWHGEGEYKMLCHFKRLVRMNTGGREVLGSILFGKDGSVALNTLLESSKGNLAFRFDRIYENVHFIPLNRDGQDMLKLMRHENWRSQILDALFPTEIRTKGQDAIECDAIADGLFILSHLDGDIARLARFRESCQSRMDCNAEVVCFPWQLEYLRKYLGQKARFRTIEMHALEAAIE